jgi:hypothetical protein
MQPELALWRAVRSDVTAHQLVEFRSTGRLSVARAISVYKNAYWGRQHDVLRELFPRVVRVLGEARFRELVRRYVLASPSAHPELEHLGHALPAFLRAQPDEDLARVAGLAAYEQALVESFLAPDHVAATTAEVVPATFALARLRFAPSLRVVATDDVLLRALAEERKSVISAAAVAVARPRHAVVPHVVGAAELDLLELATRGAMIAELLDECARDISAAHACIERWFRRAWIAAIDSEPS